MPLAPHSFLYQHDPHTGVATITLNRPARLNALTFDVYRELRDAFRALDGEPGVRAVVITGAGRAFCSGGDVEEIIGDRKSTRLNSSHLVISYAVFCLKKKKKEH